jgi:hypothetical protein
MADLNGITTATGAAAIKAKIYSAQLREQLQPALNAMQFVDVITGFPDGDSWYEAEIGNATMRDFQEGGTIAYDSLDIGSREFTINNYVSSGHKISEKFLQDSYLSAQIAAKIPGLEARAIYVDLETKILANQAGQTLGEENVIDGVKHRFVAGGNSTPRYGTLVPEDFFYAGAGLTVHGYTANRIAIVPAWQEYVIPTNPDFMESLNFNPKWEGIVASGAVSGMKFVFNIAGFDVYTSNYTPVVTETIQAREGTTDVAAVKAGVAMLFSNEAGRRPWRLAWRMMPKMESAWDMDTREEKYVTVARYGIGAGDKANLFCILCAHRNTSTFTAQS